MKTFLKYVLRNIAEKKGRSILIIVSLVIASSVMILNLTIPNQIVEANTNKMKSLVGSSDLVIAKYEKFDINDINKDNTEYNYVGVNSMGIIHKDKTLMLYGTNIYRASYQKLIEVNSLNDDEIIINKDTANKFNYKLNDTLKIEFAGTTYELKIVNILDSKGLLFFKTYSGVLNETTFNKIFKMPSDKYMMYYLDVKDDLKIDQFDEYLKNHNKEFTSGKLVDEEAIKENNSYVTLILAIIFVMAVIMIFFVVSTLNKMIIMERTPVIATFRSIGATKKKMNAILILENSMYGLIGGIIGSLVSLLISNFCVKLLLGGTEIETSVPLINLVAGVIFAVVLEIIMSIGAIIKSNRYSIKELMFDKVSSRYELNKKETILSVLCILSSIILYLFVGDENAIIDLLKITLFWIGIANAIPLFMRLISHILNFISKKFNKGSLIIGSKNIGYNKMIISSSRLVVVSISIMLVILNISNAFDNMIDSFKLQFEDYDIFIRELSKVNTEYEDLINIEGINDVTLVYLATSDDTKNYGEKLSVSPLILGMKESRPDIEELDYKIKDLKINEALVDEVYLKNNKWEVGKKIKLNLDGYEGEHEFVIKGTINSFYQSVQRDVIVINEEYFVNNLSKIPFQVTLAVDDRIDLSEMTKTLEHTLKDPDIVIMTVDEFVNSQRKNVHTIMYLFYIIIGLALMLSFVGIINNQIISFMERTKELAVLNSVCMSKAQLRSMLIIESITANLSACVLGFLASIMSVKLINSVLNGIMMYINVKFDLHVGFMFVGAMLVVLLTTIIIPVNKLRKINVVETIKYE